MSARQEVIENMLMMGYAPERVEEAWTQSAVKTVEGLIDWIDSHPETVEGAVQPAEPMQPVAPPTNTNVEAYVNKQWVDELVAQGHSLLIAQKAMLLSGNKGTEAALQWIAAHQNDPDFAEPIAVEAKPRLSAEEAALQARLLQEQIREKIKAEEAKNQLESERLRVKAGKEMAEARRAQDEQKKQLEMEAYLRNKAKDEADKAEMLRRLEEDKKQRFGDKYVSPAAVSAKTPQAQLVETYNKMYNIHRMGQLRELHTCLNTLLSIVTRVLDKPEDAQFRTINASNPNFAQRVKDIVGGVHILSLMGFEEKEGFYVMEQPNTGLLREFQQTLKQKVDFLATQF